MLSEYINRLIVFTRCPETGKTKTRLIPLLGAEGAANLQRKMTEHTLKQMKTVSASDEITVEIRYDGGNEEMMRGWLGSDYEYNFQGSGDLGYRMLRAFEDAFKAGAATAVIIGTDIPDITGADIQRAFAELRQNNMVLGPAEDGGYYLIGLQKASQMNGIHNLFDGMNWGERDIFYKTLNAARGIGLRVSILDQRKDVDRPEDISIWERFRVLRSRDAASEQISVIIPALNEADNIAETLSSIGYGNNTEVIVVDGGSHDDTVSIAKTRGARVIKGSPPRSRQMNQGADAASGDVLLFLHADTRLPENFDRHILGVIKLPGISAGAFTLHIDSPVFSLRLIERIANLRSRCLKTPYGDQAIFVLSSTFHELGGFPDIPIMEDFELIRKLRKKGDIVTLPEPVQTSARRWLNFGILKTTLINQLIIVSYFMGISPVGIARLYSRRKGIS
ncbi:MAG: TIGR04283 family arsenosugar biosynthesis glycosyltransferase [Desulfobacterales bacterium]